MSNSKELAYVRQLQDNLLDITLLFIFPAMPSHFNAVIESQLISDTQPFPKQALVFTCLQYKSFENTAGKGEIARNEQFLLFPQCFLPILENFLPFSSN